MAEGKRWGLDHSLIRIKDGIIIMGSIAAFLFWFVGIMNLPKTVEGHDSRIKTVESYMSKNDVVVASMQRDLVYLKESSNEIKALIIANRGNGNTN